MTEERNRKTKQHPVELLAPAKNLECGLAAVDHGADAVYIGAPRFGARSTAGNTLEDIAALTAYAHLYNVRIYVTVNTILKDEELAQTQEMIWELYRAGVDAIIVQDMAVLRLNLPPIALHASTQADNRTAEKVRFLAGAGFSQVVLARELTLEEIRSIHQSCDVPLEVFVHGALCVSYSGQCYASQACYGRSANRGECAQFCRLPFNLVDADGKVIVKEKHLLSLKDLNLSENLEELLDAGAASLKIEGRLKDVAYVKNVTAYYRRKLDEVIARRPEFKRSSSGTIRLDFTPQPEKSFSRGSTDYFLHGRSSGIFSFDTPKSLGEEMGTVKAVYGNYLVVAGVKPFSNGDGLCFLDEKGKLCGFRVNRADANKLYPHEMPQIGKGTTLYRNFDQEFEKQLARKSAERKLGVDILFEENAFGFTLSLSDEDGNRISITREAPKEPARTPQSDNLRTQLGKLGNTPFEARNVEIRFRENWFVPASVLADMRRQGVEKLLQLRRINYCRPGGRIPVTSHAFPQTELTYLGNVMNREAGAFYAAHGVQRADPAFEAVAPQPGSTLMFCRHCLRYSLGWCPKISKKQPPYREPYYLVSSDGRRFRLVFDCRACEMHILEES